jgi:hypothetical protein
MTVALLDYLKFLNIICMNITEIQLVEKATRILCIQSRSQSVKFTDFLLDMCYIRSLKNVIMSKSDINNLSKYIKSELYKRSIKDNTIWKDQIQQCIINCVSQTL